jgi:hypothetical protein
MVLRAPSFNTDDLLDFGPTIDSQQSRLVSVLTSIHLLQDKELLLFEQEDLELRERKGRTGKENHIN